MKKLLMNLIRFYQKNISPATQPTCRYHPTCSNYALEAVDKHGALKGGIMGTARILRCNPFIDGGVDRVPDYFTVRRNPANIDEQYIPDYLQSDPQAKKEIEKLLPKYGDQLQVSSSLSDPFVLMDEIVDLKELSVADLEAEFSADEISYLQDIRVLPDLTREEYFYYTLQPTSKNNQYLQEVVSYDEGILLGEEHPLIILEQTGVWYMNLPKLLDTFLSKRGVTEGDVESNSYYLWMVLEAIARENQREERTDENFNR